MARNSSTVIEQRMSAVEALKRLKAISSQQGESPKADMPNDAAMVAKVAGELQALVLSVLKLPIAEFAPTTSLLEYGLDSIAATEIGSLFTEKFGIVVPPTVFFEFPDVQSFSRYLVESNADELQKRYAAQGARGVSSESAQGAAPMASPAFGKEEAAIPRTLAQKAEGGPLTIEQLWDLGRDDAGSAPAAPPVTPTVKQPSRAQLQEMMVTAEQARVFKCQRNGKPDLECYTLGEGPPLLMLGGLLMVYSAMWRPQLAELSAHHKLIMFHMPGCGGLDIYNDLSLANLVCDVNDLLDALGIEEPLPVIGCSFGGVLAQSFCLAHPERCSQLVIGVSTPLSEGATDFQVLMKELQTSSSFMEVNRGWPMASLPAYTRVIEGFDLRDRLPSIKIPTLVIAGGRDRYTPPEHSRIIASKIAGAKLIEVPDAGHLLPFTHFETFNATVLAFLGATGETRRAPASTIDHGPWAPATQSVLASIEAYIRQGAQGHCVILPECSAQVAVLLNTCCNRGKDGAADYRSYFVTSFEEAFDAAIRLVRHHARNSKPDSDGTVVLCDGRDDFWKSYVDPLGKGPTHALIPAVHVVGTTGEALELLTSKGGNVAAVVVVAHRHSNAADIDVLLQKTEGSRALRVLVEWNDADAPLRGRFVERLTRHPDVVVFGEALTGHQAPFGSCTVKTSIANPWLMTPNEGYVRQPMAAMGMPTTLARDHLLATLEVGQEVRSLVDQIGVSPKASYEAHVRHGNIGYARVARMHGYDATFFNARGMRSQVAHDGSHAREIVDCLLNVGSCPRGLNSLDIVDGVLKKHDAGRDYWTELGAFLRDKTGFDVTLPASSQTSAIESAITLGLLAAGKRSKMLCFIGGAGFSLISAASALDPVFDLWRKPFRPVYPNVVFVDPLAADAEAQLRAELCSGEIGLVLLETIQVEGSAVRAVPANLIGIVEELRQTGQYLVAVDETQTNLWCGRLLHSDGIISAPDIVALGTALCDSLMPAGAVMTSSGILDLARRRSPQRAASLSLRHRCQLSAHFALHSLTQIFESNLVGQVPKVAAYFREQLKALSRDYPLLKQIRGEGLLIAVELDLEGQPPFIERGFGYYLWGAMLRDPDGGVAAVVCPIHNNSLRLVPALNVTFDEIDAIVANLRRRLQAGVAGVIRDCAHYQKALGDERTSTFLLKQIGAKEERSVPMQGNPVEFSNVKTVKNLTSKRGMPTVCIIGAGVGGISMAGQLQKQGIPFDCFDKRERIGGIWAYDEQRKNTSVWSTLNMNTPLGHYQFSDFPMPANYPDFPQWHQVQAYLESYIDHLDMRSSFHLGHTVVSARRLDGGRWRVELGTGEVRVYDALVVANGHHNTPNYPDYADKIKFDGEAIHSQHYRSRHDYRGKRVMIVGIGNSGAQIAVDVSHDADITYISTRRGVYLLPHYLFGFRIDRILGVTLSWWFKKALPGILYPAYFTGIYHLVGNHRKIGMPKPDHLMMTCLPTVTESLANRIGDGRIKLVPEVKHIEGKTVHFADGTSQQVDSIIYSTGYHTTLAFFEKDFFEVRNNVVPLYKRIFLPGVPNLAFVGMFQAIRWGFLDVMETQAKLIAAYFSGIYKLPSVGEQKDDIAKERAQVEREFMHTLRNNYYLHGDTYVRDLKKEVGRGRRRMKKAPSGQPVSYGGDVVSATDIPRGELATAAE